MHYQVNANLRLLSPPTLENTGRSLHAIGTISIFNRFAFTVTSTLVAVSVEVQQMKEVQKPLQR